VYKIKNWILAFIDPDFIRTVDFFAGVSSNKSIERKNIFHGNPVEVRSFDGTVL
jgi:hypothetical protein